MDIQTIWPTTSNAFFSVESITNTEVRGSPPRKAARLGSGSDSATRGNSNTFLESLGRNSRRKLSLNYTVPILNPNNNDSSCLNIIRHAIRALLDKEGVIPFPPVSVNTIFDSVEMAVLVSGKGPEIYGLLNRELERSCAEGIARRLSKREVPAWLSAFVSEWQWFEEQLNRIEALLSWLDRAHASSMNLSSIRSLGLKAFEQCMFNGNVLLHHKIAPCIEEWVTIERHERRKESFLRDQIMILIRICQVLNVYHQEFHIPYILYTREYYVNEAAMFRSDPKNSPMEFVSHCIDRITEEAQRCRDVVPEESFAAIEHAAEVSLLNGHITWLVQNGVAPLVDSRNITGLKRLYDLLEKVDALEALKSAFAKSVEDSVAQIVLLPVEREDEMIPMLLNFKSFIDTLLVAAFREEEKIQLEKTPVTGASIHRISVDMHKTENSGTLRRRGRGAFGYAATDAFAKGFMKRHRKPAEMIARYIDKAMRKGQQGETDKEFIERLDTILSLYQFTKDRDVFRTFYWRTLAKRLLLKRSASDDFEKAVIKKLRDGYDPEFGKGEEMFKDLALSNDLLFDYREKYPIDNRVSIMVLQESQWPYTTKQGPDIDLPPEMLFSLDRYSTFYKTKHKQKKLNWIHELGTATLTARFNAGEKELSVSLYQGVILLLFNTSTKLRFTDIKQLTNIEDSQLRRILQSLACGKKRVLKKLPMGKDVNDIDDFIYNADFTDPSRNIHVNSIQQKISVEESKATDSKVQEDRTYLLDAAIVRVMKSKKHLTSQNLVNETIQAVKGHFHPDIRQIKKQIESLTEKEYLRRDDNHRDLYHYVA